MILAQYSIRSKQEYIFKTNKVLEIIGASENIARIWEFLLKTASENNLKVRNSREKFDINEIKKEFEQNSLNVVELFCGGGNETLLIDSKENYLRLNRAFSKKLISKYPGMIPMVVGIEVKGDEYSSDYRKLKLEEEKKKNVMEQPWNMFTVPFAMMDRNTFQPYSRVITIENKQVRMTDESYSKYIVGRKLRNSNNDIRFFDEMVTQKGKESLLAIVHADGNNMGYKIMGMLKDEKDYNKAIPLMRDFTNTTADCFEVYGEEALKRCKERLLKENAKQINEKKLKESSLSYRRIIRSGDDVTIICNGRFVMDYVKAYLDAVQNYQKDKGGKWGYSSCAGICIFHSHFPFSTAYSIAEQACDDGAKVKVHSSDVSGKLVEQGWMDFHFIHNGIGGDLKEIRKNQGINRCVARPWLVSVNNKDELSKEDFCYEKLLKLKDIVENNKKYGMESPVSRTAIKTIGSAFEGSEAAAKKELISLYGHTPNLEKAIKSVYKDENTFLKALYDFAEIYDLWYRGV